MISDVLIFLVALVFIIVGAVRGAAKTLLNLAAVAAAAIGARLLAFPLADWVYQSFIREGAVATLTDWAGSNGALFAAQNCLDALPKWLSAVASAAASLFGFSVGGFPGGLSVEGIEPSAAAEAIAEAIEQPLGVFATALISVLLTVLIFIVLLVVAKLLVKLALKLFELGPLKVINRIFGAFLGIGEGFVCVWLAIQLIYAILIVANPSLLDNTFYFGTVFRFLCLFV